MGVACKNFMKNIRWLYYNAATSTAVAVQACFMVQGSRSARKQKTPDPFQDKGFRRNQTSLDYVLVEATSIKLMLGSLIYKNFSLCWH
jgi:hypothetical protein